MGTARKAGAQRASLGADSLLDGIAYRYRRVPGRPTIVFLHGLTGSSSAWEPFEAYFSKYSTLSIDLRGHGLSVRPKEYDAYCLAAFTDDVYRVLSHERIRTCILIAHSYGALVAFDLLDKHPSLVSKCVLIGADCAPARNRRAKLLLPIISFFSALFARTSPKKGGVRLDYRRYRDTGDWNVRRMYADIKNSSLKSYFCTLRQSYECDLTGSLPRIKAPVLLIHGKKDTLIPLERARYMATLIPGARLAIMPQANHLPVLNDIEELCALIGSFL